MNLFKLTGKLAIEGVDKAKSDLNDVTNTASGSSSKLGGVMSSIGNVAVTAGKIALGAVATTGTAIVGITKQAVDAYGQYEQLVGGVETLFKDSAKTVLEYAHKAYATAGLSANAYMETVTSFTASLLQGLDGDTAETAKVADMAIQDMADNANKMGTSMQMIQNAYQGFSKQNYMMLDNLKLGYGGTKGEMERLLAHAKELTGIEYDINNLADVYKAIHEVQKELGITGTTAKEAGDTIQGSMSAVKAQWENVLVALADEKQDLGATIDIWIQNLTVAIQNMMPKILEVFRKIPLLLTQVAPLFGQMIMNLAPSLLASVYSLIVSLAQAIPNMLGNFNSIFTKIIDVVETNIPIVVAKAQEMMGKFGETLKENIPIVASKALDMLLSFSQKVIENVPKLVSSGMDMIKNIVQGIMNSLPTLLEKAPQIIINFANTINRSMTTIFLKGAEIIWEIIKGIISAIPALIDNFPKVIEAIISVWSAINWMNLGKNLMSGISNGIKNMGASLKQTASNVFNSLKTNIGNIFNNIKTAITSPITGASNMFSGIVTGIKNVAITAFNALKGSVGSIFTGIKNSIVSPIETAKTIIKGIVDTIKGFFNFRITLPHIPMPHFSISPSGWKLGDLLKGKIPSLGISWYEKAMDDGMILDSPTIFGYQNGKLLGGGEAGSETVVGTNSLMNMIQQSVLQSNARNEELMEKVLLLLSTYIPQIAQNNPQIVLDTGTLVGAITPKVDQGLGMIARMKERGR